MVHDDKEGPVATPTLYVRWHRCVIVVVTDSLHADVHRDRLGTAFVFLPTAAHSIQSYTWWQSIRSYNLSIYYNYINSVLATGQVETQLRNYVLYMISMSASMYERVMN